MDSVHSEKEKKQALGTSFKASKSACTVLWNAWFLVAVTEKQTPAALTETSCEAELQKHILQFGSRYIVSAGAHTGENQQHFHLIKSRWNQNWPTYFFNTHFWSNNRQLKEYFTQKCKFAHDSSPLSNILIVKSCACVCYKQNHQGVLTLNRHFLPKYKSTIHNASSGEKVHPLFYSHIKIWITDIFV